ncbi:uncharacterized protein JN550_009039 [Neoarthrinium moseri]|uniref:uncharacterized protein n=1 Tax=Neoarthrinium moseri TaxID=1658444 RepID=UPI001FDB6543|nr:uncharacterized protein JN550_009039 [Neoarthrinium moseri]KAI1864019.1 hypothetical protein JN550_009039 [Neoarthrinium moseri]
MPGHRFSPSNLPPHLLPLTPEDSIMTSHTSAIRVAIIGGGVAGAVLLRGLLRHPHIALDMYDSQQSFKEEDPGLELGPTTLAALRAVDPFLETCLDGAGAVYTPTDLRLATGPQAGHRLDIDGYSIRGKYSVDRQAFLAEMLAGVPPRMVHPNTRVTSIVEASPGNGLMLAFSDGTQKRYDVVIGADGVHGKTRAHVLGPSDPAHNPRPSGYWRLPINVPLGRARQLMGPEALDPRNPKQLIWIGDGTMMQHNFLNGGNDVQITTAATFDGTDEEFTWAKLFTPEEFANIFSQNSPDTCQGMVKLVQSVYTVQIAGICQMQHVPSRTYASKNACLVGDAAHGGLSLQGSACDIAVEEALVLSTLLGRAQSKSAVPTALRAFDEVCRPRAELVIRASFDINLLLTGRAPGIGLDPVLLANTLRQKWDMIENIDINAHCLKAMNSMDHQIVMGRGW